MKKVTLFIAIIALVAVCAVALCACAPAGTPDKAKAALDKHGYSASVDKSIIPAALKLLGVDGVDAVVIGTYSDDDTSEGVTIVYFYKAEQAKDGYNAVKSYAESKDGNSKDSDWEFAQSGKMIWYGTKAAIKAAR